MPSATCGAASGPDRAPPAIRAALRVLACCAILLPLAYGEGKGHGVSIRPGDKKLLEAKPQQILTLPLRVTNQTEEGREFREEVDLPQDWRLVAREMPFRLKPGESDVRLLTVYVPVTAAAGRHTLKYRVTDPRNPQILDEESIGIVVLPVARVEISAEEVPERVIAGRPYRVTFNVLSRSNVAIDVALTVASSDEFPAAADSADLSLEPRGSRKVTVSVRTPEDLQRQVRHRLTLTARAQREKTTIEDTATVQVDVIPRVSGKVDPCRRIPAQLTTSLGHENGKTNLQQGISGSGYLDDAKTKHVDFSFRQPLNSEANLFGFQEEYRFSYATPKNQFHMGDRGYGLSPLTEQYRYGRGVETGFTFAPLHFGGYFMETHREEPTEQQIGATAGYEVSERLGLDVQGLRKDRTGENDSLVSVRALARPLDSIDLGLEYGSGWQDRDHDTERDDAWRVYLEGDVMEKARFHVEKTHAGSDYPGFYSDLDFTRVSVLVPVREKLRLNASFAEDLSNIDSRPTSSAAPRDIRYGAGLTYHFPTNTSLSLDFGQEQRKDLLGPRDFDAEARRLSVALGQSFKMVNLRASSGPVWTKDNLDNSASTQLAYRADAAFSPTSRQRYTAFFGRGHEGLTADPDLELTGGMGASYDLARRLLLDTRYEKRGLNKDGIETDQFLATLRYTLPFGHVLSFEARYLTYQDADLEDVTTVFLAYDLPFGMPVGRRTDVAVLRGRIYDAEDPRKTGMADVIVFMGGVSAVTNGDGEFVFPEVKEGAHYVWVETAAMPGNRVTAEKTPIKIDIAGGEHRKVEIGIARGAQLSVQATRFQPEKGDGIVTDPDQKPKVVEAEGLPNLAVELVRDDEVIRRTTNLEGHLLVRNLRPGRWKLRIPEQKLPKLHYVETPETEIDLAPGQQAETTVKILPRFRKMILLDEEPAGK